MEPCDSPSYFTDADLGLFLFDSTNAYRSMKALVPMIKQFKEFASKNARAVLVCTKCDQLKLASSNVSP